MPLLERVQQALEANNKNSCKTLHQFASFGDTEAVKSLVENHPDGKIDINIVAPRSKNTALHCALIFKQQGFIIDYLISKGADINAFNCKGYNPITYAIIHCRPGTQALQKILHSRPSLSTITFFKGRFEGLTIVDVARQHKNEEAVRILQKVASSLSTDKLDEKVFTQYEGGSSNATEKIINNRGYCQEVGISDKGKGVCPICNFKVKYPVKMSFIEFNQKQAEKEYYNRNKESSTKDIYIQRKYMDQFMTQNNGEAYKKLCQIEFHGVANMQKLRKEISESYSILHAVQDSVDTLRGTHRPTSSDDMKGILTIDNVFLIDLCSGKSLTAAIFGALFTKENNNHVLAVDRLRPHMVPHFLSYESSQYLSRDIFDDIFFKELEQEVYRQTVNEGRTAVLVGCHLCGILSERAIEFFDKIPFIEILILSPCCLPKLSKGNHNFLNKKIQCAEESYIAWSEYLKKMVASSCASDDTAALRSYRDEEMHSPKNSIITAVRKKL
mmetsp:Transcript_29136/g.33851  ORF Transcript_29136/g.33851 Transcript_29136/m.33851 type:complete len:500 (+) Transcript_29136:39-1538(+)